MLIQVNFASHVEEVLTVRTQPLLVSAQQGPTVLKGKPAVTNVELDFGVDKALKTAQNFWQDKMVLTKQKSHLIAWQELLAQKEMMGV